LAYNLFMETELHLYRGFVVDNLKVVAKKGFSVPNPKWHFLGESNWPGGLSLGRYDALGLAEEIAAQAGGIPVCGRIRITEDSLKDIYLLGIKRVLSYEGGMSPGSIDHWRCLNWNDVLKSWEFSLKPRDLGPKQLLKLEGAVSSKEGIYEPFTEFKRGIEGGSFRERFLG
jgi:hypothetical protein